MLGKNKKNLHNRCENCGKRTLTLREITVDEGGYSIGEDVIICSSCGYEIKVEKQHERRRDEDDYQRRSDAKKRDGKGYRR